MRDPEATQVLVDRAKDGDRAAFDALIERFHGLLRSRIESWSQFQLGPRLDIGEVLQDSFIRAFRALGRFEWQHGDDAFFRWLCGVAKRALAETARNARREALRRGGDASVGGLPGTDPTSSQIVRRHERFDRLEAALGKLRPDYRRVLLLSRIEGLTVRQTAERMQRSPDSVKHLIARALRELRKHFGDTESFRLADRRLDTEGQNHGE